MASVTHTSTLVARSGVQSRAVHAGVNAVSVYWPSGAALSASGVVFACLVPQGALIHNFLERHTSGATSQVLDIGIRDSGGSHSYSAIASGLAQGVANCRLDKGPYQVPDSSGDRIVTISKESGTVTVSTAVTLTIFYTMDTGAAG